MVRREGFGAAEEQLDAVIHQRRHALHGFLHVRHHAVPVGLDVVEAEVLGDAVHAPGLRDGFEEPEHDLAGLLADVGRVAGIAEDRQHPVHAFDRLGDQVVVLAGLQRHVDARHAADLARPHAGAVDDELGLDVAAVGAHAGHLALVGLDAEHLRVLEDPGAAHARALGEGLRDVGRVHPAVVREVEGGLDVRDVGERPHLLDLRRGDLAVLDPEAARHRAAPAHLVRLVVGHRELDGTAVDDAGRLARFGLEPAVEVLRVLRELGLRLRVAQRRQQARGVPGRATGQLLAFEQHDILPAELGEVVGDGTADDTAADDHDLRAAGKRIRHGWIAPLEAGMGPAAGMAGDDRTLAQ